MNQSARVLIRLSLGGLYFWFGWMQFTDQNPIGWITFLPDWTGYLPMPGAMLVHLNGWFELVFSVMLLFGFQTRLIAGLLGFHLIVIALSVGGALGVRDLVLALCTLALTISQVDSWTLDHWFNKKRSTLATQS